MPSVATPIRPSKPKLSGKRRELPAGVTGAELLARAKSGDFGRGLDWAAVGAAHGTRRGRSRAA